MPIKLLCDIVWYKKPYTLKTSELGVRGNDVMFRNSAFIGMNQKT